MGSPARDWAGVVMLAGPETLPEHPTALWTPEQWKLIREQATYRATLALLSEIHYGRKIGKTKMAEHRSGILEKIRNSGGAQ